MLDHTSGEPSNTLAFLDIISPALDKVEKTCPDHEHSASFRAALDLWVEWASHLEAFFWDFGNQLLGSETWIPATDAVGDYKIRVRRLREAFRRDDRKYLRSIGVIADDPFSTVDEAALRTLLVDPYIFGLVSEARATVDDLSAGSENVLLPTLEESPEPETPDDAAIRQ